MTLVRTILCDGAEAGRILYEVGDRVLCPCRTFVRPEFRGRGLAEAALRRLRAEFPREETTGEITSRRSLRMCVRAFGAPHEVKIGRHRPATLEEAYAALPESVDDDEHREPCINVVWRM